jgi:hypothetical protein
MDRENFVALPSQNTIRPLLPQLFLPVFLGVSLHHLLGVSARVDGVGPRGVSMVRRLLVVSTLEMLGRLSMVAGCVCQMLRGLLVVFNGFLRHLCSSANEPQLTTMLHR